VVVFRRREEHGVRSPDRGLERGDAKGIARRFDIAVVERHVNQVERHDRHACGRALNSGAQERAIERSLPQAPRDAEHAYVRHGPIMAR